MKNHKHSVFFMKVIFKKLQLMYTIIEKDLIISFLINYNYKKKF